jgi:ABC-type transport system involved in multi-copper enzyme maturation permease subunit
MVTPYRSAVAPARPPGPGALLRAELTKLRTVRGFMTGLLLAMLAPVGITVLGNSGGCMIATSDGRTYSVECPRLPTGPDGSAAVDSFYFVHQALPADGAITARVTSLAGLSLPAGVPPGSGGTPAAQASGTQPWSKAGIMIKASTTAGSAYAAMLVTGSHGTRMQWDYAGDTAGLTGAASASSPRWLRLVRSGSVVTGYDSLNGTSWTRVGSVPVRGLPAHGTVQAGLFATSPSRQPATGYDGPTLATGTFDGITVSGASGPRTGTSISPQFAPLPPGVPLPRAGKPGARNVLDGSYQALAGGTVTVTGSGDIAPDVTDAPDGRGQGPQSTLTGIFLTLIVVIVVAALFVAAEYRRGMIAVTFAAAPSRWRVLAAKSVVIGAVAFVAGLVTVGVIFPVGLDRLRSQGNFVPPMPVLTEARMIVGSALLLAVSAVLALAIGAMARRGVLAVAGVIVVIFVPFMLAHGPNIVPASAQEWLLRVTPTAAFSVQQAYPAYHQVLAPYLPADGYYPLPPWAGLGVLILWAAAALAAAMWLVHGRDA